METVFLGAAIVLGMVALVQTFRVIDANTMIDCYRADLLRAENRATERFDELNRLEKEHSRMVQMITDFADRLNE